MPYRTPDQRRIDLHNHAQGVADQLRLALAALWVTTDRGGPRMNYVVCGEGMGLADTKNPPQWLVDALSELNE